MDLAYKAPTAVCRAVVAFVTGPAGPDVLLMVAGFGSTLEANLTVGALSFILGSRTTVGVVCGF